MSKVDWREPSRTWSRTSIGRKYIALRLRRFTGAVPGVRPGVRACVCTNAVRIAPVGTCAQRADKCVEPVRKRKKMKKKRKKPSSTNAIRIEAESRRVIISVSFISFVFGHEFSSAAPRIVPYVTWRGEGRVVCGSETPLSAPTTRETWRGVISGRSILG